MRVSAPGVSIVMAAHAPQPEWLREAVRSALDQRGCQLEMVLVDDGSPEPLEGMLDGVGDERLRVLRVEHGWVSAARNQGLAATGGDYVRFLDADDFFPPDSTETLLDVAGRTKRRVALGATRWCREDLSPLFDWPARGGGDPLRGCLLLRCVPMLPSILFPRALVDEVGGWDERLVVGEDWDYTLRALEHTEALETRRVVTWYRQHSGSASRDRARAWSDTHTALDSFFKRNPGRRDELARPVAAMLDLLAVELSTEKRGAWRARRFWRALSRDPTAISAVWARTVWPRVGRLALLRQPRG